jgi:hypothetical protein
MFEGVFSCKDIELEKAVTTLTGIDISARPTDPALRYDIADSVATITSDEDIPMDEVIDLEDVSFTLTYNRAEDNKIFRNSQTKIDDLICGLSGEITFTYTWDDENVMESNILDDDLITYNFNMEQPVGGMNIDFAFHTPSISYPDFLGYLTRDAFICIVLIPRT